MLLPYPPTVWSNWHERQFGLDDHHDPSLHLPSQDFAGVDSTAPGSWAWNVLGQMGANLDAMGMLEPSSYIPLCDNQDLVISYMIQPFEGLHRDLLHQTTCATTPSSFPAEVSFATMLDPTLLGDTRPESSIPASNPALPGAAQCERTLEPRCDPMIVGQRDHILDDMSMGPPVLGVGVTNSMHPALDIPVDQPTTDESPPISPDWPSTPPKILPGVYDIFGPPEPRNLVPRADRPLTPPPSRKGNEYATHLQPWGCSKCGTAFMTTELLKIHKRFHLPQPPMHEYQNPAFQVAQPSSEEKLRRSSEQNRHHSSRLRCENGKWTTFKQSMHGFGHGDDDEVEPGLA